MKSLICIALLVFASACSAKTLCAEESLATILSVTPPTRDVAKEVDERSDGMMLAMSKLPSNIVLPGTQSGATFENFLPLLSFFGLGGDLSGETSDSSSDEIGFDLNLPLFGNKAKGRELKLAVGLDRQPEAYAPLIASLAEDDRAAFRDNLEQSLGAEDDVSFTLTYSLNTADVGLHKGAAGPLFAAVIESVDATVLRPVLDRYAAATKEFTRVFGQQRPDAILGKIAAIPGMSAGETTAARQGLCDAARAFSNVNNELDKASDAALGRASLDKLAKLASNQPQLLVSFGGKDRRNAVGPSELSGKLTFGWGYRANLNKLERHMSDAGCTDGACRLDAYTGYLSENDAAIENQDRVSLSLEYREVDSYQFADPEQNVTFNAPRSRKVIGQVAIGHTFSGTVFDGMRLELSAGYEDVDDDDMLNDRAIGKLTMTKKFGDVDVPLTLIYSNKTEYVAMEATDRISANFGIKYNFDPGKK